MWDHDADYVILRVRDAGGDAYAKGHHVTCRYWRPRMIGVFMNIIDERVDLLDCIECILDEIDLDVTSAMFVGISK